MRILYYLGDIGPEAGGLFQYSLGLLRSLNVLADNHYYVAYNGKAEEVYELVKVLENTTLVEIPKFRNYQRKLLLAKILRKVFKAHFFRPVSPFNYLIKKRRIDLLHCPYQYLPPDLSVPAITTVHDLQQFHFPKYFTSANRIWREQLFTDIINRSDVVVTSFEHVRQDVITYYEKDPKQIVAQMIDLSTFLNPDLSVEKNLVPLDKFQLTETFILYPAACWQHKNHEGLLRALAKVNKEIHLVCTGSNKLDYFQQLQALVNNLGLEGRVQFLGIVSERELFSLYHSCRAVVVPTKYEATSGPLVEAIFQDVPVVCSDVTALPATIGDEAYLFSPDDYDGMAAKIERIVYDEEYRKANLENSIWQKPILRSPGLVEAFQGIYHQAIEYFKLRS